MLRRLKAINTGHKWHSTAKTLKIKIFTPMPNHGGHRWERKGVMVRLEGDWDGLVVVRGLGWIGGGKGRGLGWMGGWWEGKGKKLYLNQKRSLAKMHG